MKIVYKEIQKDDKKYKNYYVLCENGYLIPIRPSFKDGYSQLALVATKYVEVVKLCL